MDDIILKGTQKSDQAGFSQREACPYFPAPKVTYKPCPLLGPNDVNYTEVQPLTPCL